MAFWAQVWVVGLIQPWVGLVAEPQVELVFETLFFVLIGLGVLVVGVIPFLGELVTQSLILIGAGPDVWVVEKTAGI